MQKNTLLWAIIVLVVAGGAYFLLSTPAEAPSTETEAEMAEDNAMMKEAGAMMEDGTIPGEGAMMDGGDVTGDPAVTEIVYTGGGYEPASVTIKKGETVRFVNNATSQDTWPASAVHPTHSVYPEKSSADCLGSAFDACRGLKPGESWEFTFGEAGEWRFHDHAHPSKTGVVIVVE